MKKSIPLIRAIFLIVVAVIITALLLLYILGINPTVLKIAQIDKLVKNDYLYKVDDDKVADTLALSYVQFLEDEYAGYYNPEMYSQIESNWEGQSAGIGITIAKHPESGKIIIVYVSRQSPAMEAGILSGDEILKVGKKDVKGLTASEVADLVVGKEGKKVNLLLKRDKKELVVSPIRGIFDADSVDWKIVDNIGLIRILDFNELTPSQFETAINELTAQNVKGLVFDLRNNGGGLVDACTEMLDTILPKGDIIRVKDKEGNVSVEAKSDKNSVDLPMAVLINEETASASEMFVTAIKDFNKGVAVGTKSYGKGIVQTTYELFDGTAVKFTTAKVVNKRGKSFHGKGITPDIEIDLTDYEKQMFFFLKPEDDSQFLKAKEYILGK